MPRSNVQKNAQHCLELAHIRMVIGALAEGVGHTHFPMLFKPANTINVRERDVGGSSKLCEQAQSCFSFVDREGLADATADVYAAVREASC